jgi:hypothetical protein
MTYKLKYLSPLKNPNIERGPGDRGQRPDPKNWDSEETLIERDKYYALLKHRSQASFRGEIHDLTWEQWQELWPTELWLNRGRSKHCHMLVRIDVNGAWTLNNVTVCLVKDKGQYYDKGRLKQ